MEGWLEHWSMFYFNYKQKLQSCWQPSTLRIVSSISFVPHYIDVCMLCYCIHILCSFMVGWYNGWCMIALSITCGLLFIFGIITKTFSCTLCYVRYILVFNIYFSVLTPCLAKYFSKFLSFGRKIAWMFGSRHSLLFWKYIADYFLPDFRLGLSKCLTLFWRIFRTQHKIDDKYWINVSFG